jgi:hypothetical protein
MEYDKENASAQDAPDKYYADALSLANREDLDYLTRLDMLQTWLARIADGKAHRGSRKEIEGAIIALQSRSKLKTDMPEDQPANTTYGAVERSNLKRYAFRRLLERLRGFYRR